MHRKCAKLQEVGDYMGLQSNKMIEKAFYDLMPAPMTMCWGSITLGGGVRLGEHIGELLNSGEGQFLTTCTWKKHARAVLGSFVMVVSAPTTNEGTRGYKHLHKVSMDHT